MPRPFLSLPSRKIVLVALAAGLVLALGAFTLLKLMDRGRPASAPPPPTVYGVTDEEYAGLSLEPLIRTALKRASLEAVREGAEAQAPRAQTLLCLAYDFGLGVEPDPGEARRWCERAARQGESPARYVLALYERDGLAGFARNKDRANDAIAAIAWDGDARAQFDVGNLFLVGEDDFEQDDGRALDHYRRAAKQGYGPALYNAGWMYEHGRGVARDYAAALSWYEKLAATGSAVGIRAVARMHHKGHGVARDLGKAVAGYTHALEQGDAEAALMLGQMYEKGEGVAPNRDRAITLYRRAAAAGYGPAAQELARLDGR